MKVRGQRHTTAVLPTEKNPDTYSIGGWVDLKAGEDDLEKREVFSSLPGFESLTLQFLT